jgi:hypothetical protein
MSNNIPPLVESDPSLIILLEREISERMHNLIDKPQ